MITKFWIIWNPQGKTPPKVTFDRIEDAERVAKGLAKNNPGQNFHVMGCEGFAHAVDPVTYTHVYGELPF